MDRRLLAAILAGAVIALSWWAWPSQDVPPQAAVDLVVDGPGWGWNGTVLAAPATAFHALIAAAETGNFTVAWTGPEGQRYVSAINGHASGWCIQVNGQDSPVSGDRLSVADGDVVRWYWTDDACVRY